MEVEEENSTNHLHESITTTTTVSDERLPENNSSNDNELGKEVSESDDPNPPSVAVAVGETADEKEEVAGGCRNSAVVEEEDGKEGDLKDGIAAGDDVAAVEHGESELTSSDKVEDRDNDVNVVVVEENVKNSGEDTNTDGSLAVVEDVKDGGEGAVDAVIVEEDGTGIDEREEVIMADVKNDVAVETEKENVEIVVEEEAIAEDQDANDFKEEGIDANEDDQDDEFQKGIVADEGVEEEGKMEDEEKGVSATDNDEEEQMVGDEEKSLDTELETDEEATMADDEEKVSEAEAMETELVESSSKSKAGKRKRGGRNSKTTPKPKVGRRKMTEEEDVCFICFDGGELVLCDRRWVF